MPHYRIDPGLLPTTFDLIHLVLAGTIVLLLVLWLLTLMIKLSGSAKARQTLIDEALARAGNRLKPPAPEVKVVEKIVEVVKEVPAPVPEPVVLKEATPDAALQLLSLLQKEARLVDFLMEDVTQFQDHEVGVAARVVHEGCNKVLADIVELEPVRTEAEGDKITLAPGFDAGSVRLTGNIQGQAPFTGVLTHKGWRAKALHLPKLTEKHNAQIIAPAEVEL